MSDDFEARVAELEEALQADRERRQELEETLEEVSNQADIAVRTAFENEDVLVGDGVFQEVRRTKPGNHYKDTTFETCSSMVRARVVCGMTADPVIEDNPFDLHCGVCEHVHFQDDWNRTPYCTYHGRETEIRVGDVCSQFEEQSGNDGEDEQSDDKLDADSVEIGKSDELKGVTGPFYAVYADGQKQGWYCSTCEAFDVAAGPMGRLKCNNCGNLHQSNEWDAAYL